VKRLALRRGMRQIVGEDIAATNMTTTGRGGIAALGASMGDVVNSGEAACLAAARKAACAWRAACAAAHTARHRRIAA